MDMNKRIGIAVLLTLSIASFLCGWFYSSGLASGATKARKEERAAAIAADVGEYVIDMKDIEPIINWRYKAKSKEITIIAEPVELPFKRAVAKPAPVIFDAFEVK